MRNLVVLSDGSGDDGPLLSVADELAGSHGEIVMLRVLPGSLVSHLDSPDERGRRRRLHENVAVTRLDESLARSGLVARTVALFGDQVDDLVLLAGNLAADAVVVGAQMPDLARLAGVSPCPVVVVPQAEAPA